MLTADRRSLPGETYEQMCAELERELAAVESRDARPPHRAPPAARRHGDARARGVEDVAVGSGSSKQPQPPPQGLRPHRRARRFPAWTDGALLSAFAGIPTLILGPGDLAVAHSPEESVEIAQVIEAARIYAIAATEFCGRTT